MGFSLLVVERGMEGFERGRKLDKIGLDAQDTAELSFTDVKVPVENLLGEEGSGFIYLMQNLPQERIGIAVMAAAAMEAVLEQTLQYTKDRKASASRSEPAEQPVPAGRAVDRGHCGADDGRRVPEAASRGEADRRAGRDGEVVLDRDAGRSDRPLPAVARRLRLHARVSRRAGISRLARQTIYGGTTRS